LPYSAPAALADVARPAPVPRVIVLAAHRRGW
jgi:hypothetical protein